jgi:hypothetical protein
MHFMKCSFLKDACVQCRRAAFLSSVVGYNKTDALTVICMSLLSLVTHRNVLH